MSKNERYNDIAKACLKALNEAVASGKPSADATTKVYQAIDDAFNEELATLQSDLADAVKTLKTISEDCAHLEEAQQVAKKALANLIGHSNHSPLH